jgi:hypothetical protein
LASQSGKTPAESETYEVVILVSCALASTENMPSPQNAIKAKHRLANFHRRTSHGMASKLPETEEWRQSSEKVLKRSALRFKTLSTAVQLITRSESVAGATTDYEHQRGKNFLISLESLN